MAFPLVCSCQDIINSSSCFLPLLPYTVSCNEELSQLSPASLQQHTNPQQHVPSISLSVHSNVFAKEMRTSTVPLLYFIQRCGRLKFGKEHFQHHVALISTTRTVAPNVTDTWGFVLSCDHWWYQIIPSHHISTSVSPSYNCVTDWFTQSIKMLYRETDILFGSQKMRRILCNLNISCHEHRSPLLVLIPSQIYPLYTYIPFFCNIVLPRKSRSLT